MRCRVCGKPLSGPSDIGPVCAKHRADALQLHLPDVTPRITAVFDDDFEGSDPYAHMDETPEVVDFDALRKIAP